MEFHFEEFVAFVNATHKTLQKIKSFKIEKYGIKGYHLLAMHYIATSEEGLTSGELCDYFKEDKAAVSRYLNKLYGKGFITLQEEEGKKYKLKNILTEEGAKVYEELKKPLMQVEKMLKKGISSSKLESFSRTLDIVVENFNDVLDKMEK